MKGTFIDHSKFIKIFAPSDSATLDQIYAEAVSNPFVLYTIYDTSSKIFSGLSSIPTNLKFLYATQNEASAVAGYFCYLLQKEFPDVYKNQVGMIFGEFNNLALEDFLTGFQFGYSYIDKTKQVILCDTPATFTNNQISFEVTESFIQKHPEIGILFPLLGAAYLGSYNSIYNNHLYVIGADSDSFQYVYSFNPNLAYIVIASVTKYMNQLLFKYLKTCPCIKRTSENTSYNMHDGVVDFITSSFMIGEKYPLDIRMKVDEFKKAIEDGFIIVPSAY